MKNIILGAILTLMPMSLQSGYPLVKIRILPSFNTLLTLCVNGGTGSIWLDWDRVVYFHCKQIKPPKRYPK